MCVGCKSAGRGRRRGKRGRDGGRRSGNFSRCRSGSCSVGHHAVAVASVCGSMRVIVVGVR